MAVAAFSEFLNHEAEIVGRFAINLPRRFTSVGPTDRPDITVREVPIRWVGVDLASGPDASVNGTFDMSAFTRLRDQFMAPGGALSPERRLMCEAYANHPAAFRFNGNGIRGLGSLTYYQGEHVSRWSIYQRDLHESSGPWPRAVDWRAPEIQIGLRAVNDGNPLTTF